MRTRIFASIFVSGGIASLSALFFAVAIWNAFSGEPMPPAPVVWLLVALVFWNELFAALDKIFESLQ